MSDTRDPLSVIQEKLDFLVSSGGYAAASVVVTGFDRKQIELNGVGGLGQRRRLAEKIPNPLEVH